MSTWADWLASVKLAYQGTEPTANQLQIAVKDGARAVMVRDIESDLALAKSYRDSFRDAKLEVAGTRITDAIDVFVASVKELMPIDTDTEAADAILVNAIKAGYNSVNALADRFDALVVEAAIELQRHIPFFQSRHENTYLQNTSGVTAESFVSKIAPPDGMRLSQIWYGRYSDPLAEGVAYVADDLVQSNGRIYICRTGGTLTAGQLGAGLTTTDYSDEEIGDGLVFQFYCPVILVPVRNYTWVDRARLRAGRFSGGPVYCIDDQSDELWFYPAIDDSHQFVMEWVGIKQAWEDDDEVTFEAKAASAAAHFIRSALIRELGGDGRVSVAEFALWQREVRGLVVDEQQRKTGTTNQVAAYDYYRRCGLVGVLGCRIGSSGSGSGTYLSTTSGFSTTVTSLALLAAVPTANLEVPSFLTWWNADTETLVTYKLEAGDAATGSGIQRPDDFDATTNAKIWVAVE